MKSQRNNTIFFKLISISAVIIFFLLIEILVRIFVPANQQQDRLIDLGELSFFSKVTVKGEPSIRITNKYGYSDQQTTFSERKSPDTYRIFCLGGSASAGWPHPASERFSTYLDTCLRLIYPKKHIEIINCSAHGFASYRVREIFHQLIPFHPDAVIVWSGNNEFLEDQRFKISEAQKIINWLAARVRIVQVIKKILPKHELDGNEIAVAHSFWKKVQQQSLELCTDPKLALKVRQVYKQSIEGIAKEAKVHGIKVLLFTVPVNLRDWQPNVSYCALKAQDSIAWARKYNLGCNALNKHNYHSAVGAFKEAISKDPNYAMSHFLLARSYEGLNDTSLALQNYIQARDLDYNPFRAISDFNDSVCEIAEEYDNVVLFDAVKLFKEYSHHGIPGFDLFLDYVHPTREGNIVLATGVGEFIREKNFLGLGNSKMRVDTALLRTSLSNYRDDTDLSVQITRYSLCCLTHQYESAVKFGHLILANMNKSSQLDHFDVADINKVKEGVAVFSQYLEVEKKIWKGMPREREWELAMSAVNKFYKTYYPYGTF